jgi:hypothetical protein
VGEFIIVCVMFVFVGIFYWAYSYDPLSNTPIVLPRAAPNDSEDCDYHLEQAPIVLPDDEPFLLQEALPVPPVSGSGKTPLARELPLEIQDYLDRHNNESAQ